MRYVATSALPRLLTLAMDAMTPLPPRTNIILPPPHSYQVAEFIAHLDNSMLQQTNIVRNQGFQDHAAQRQQVETIGPTCTVHLR